MRRRNRALIGLTILVAVLAFAFLAPVIPATVGSNLYCTAQQINNMDFSWGHGGCYSSGMASLTWYFFGYSAYYTLGVYVPPIQSGLK